MNSLVVTVSRELPVLSPASPSPEDRPSVPRRLQLTLKLSDDSPPWPILDQRERGTRFLGLPIRSVLNSPASTGMNFWSLNPYVGCEFGCSYCYARDTHRWVVERGARGEGEPSPLDTHSSPLDAFERDIFVKQDLTRVLRQTLDPVRLGEHPIVIGTATDPYQPAERRFRLTRRVLETLADYRGLRLGIITKSPLIARDRDLLTELAARHDLSVNLSLISLDAELVRRLEPRTPVPRARLRALAALTAAGIHAGVLIAPILPGLTDSRRDLSALMRAAKEAGARYVAGLALRLGPTAKARFLPVLAREFPALAARYQRHYAQRVNAARAYTEALAQRIRALKRRHGFALDHE